MILSDIKILADRIKANIAQVIVGRDENIDLVLTALFCGGHVLLEDVPGTGKTVLAKCLARSIDCEFKRIQFTPDLLPSELTGINYYNQKLGDFIFRPGPIFTNLVLADEINRATPRTQSSLLECMEEKQVSVDGETRTLGNPFFVIATQNPVETQGTFPLPEAQLDRFFVRLKMGYPTAEEGKQILDRFQQGSPLPSLEAVTNGTAIMEVQQAYMAVKVSDELKAYIIALVEATRAHERVALGVSPRGSLALLKAAQAYASIKGRDYVTPDDVKHVARPVLGHRLILKGHALSNSLEAAEAAIGDILGRVPVPTEAVLQSE